MKNSLAFLIFLSTFSTSAFGGTFKLECSSKGSSVHERIIQASTAAKDVGGELVAVRPKAKEGESIFIDVDFEGDAEKFKAELRKRGCSVQ